MSVGDVWKLKGFPTHDEMNGMSNQCWRGVGTENSLEFSCDLQGLWLLVVDVVEKLATRS